MKKNFVYRGLKLAVLLIVCVGFLSTLNAGQLKVLHEKTFSTSFGKKLSINTSAGDVYVSTWDKPEVYIKISGNKKAYDKMQFRFESNNEGVNVTAKRDSWFNWFSWSNVYVKYEIKVPVNYNAVVTTAGGDIKLYDLNGHIQFQTSGGDVTLINTKGEVAVGTSGGEIKLENTIGQINVRTSGGDIKIKNFEGNLTASTSGGDIQLEGKSGKIDASTSGGDIVLKYGDVNQGIDLSSSGGDIIVKVPGDFAAVADLSTTGGDIECDLPITRNGKWSSSKVKGEINGGGKILRCRTSGGDIKVTK
ncbi:MAG: DUF4097 family beta strand repeat-containing protein [Ignavibacteriales bacterium]